MKRRHFGLLTGSSLAVAAAGRQARAQTAAPDASLLATTLTPLGGERAGNADNSIPAWTGGHVTAPLPPNQPVNELLFTDEQPIYTVDASNLTQYQNLLSAGTKALMAKKGFKIKVYPTHRTAAAPQYVYDNTALNVARSKLDPAGGRFGFTGGFSGPPFPIVDTVDPEIGGVQLIWNALVVWGGYSIYNTFSGGVVVNSKGQTIFTHGGQGRILYPYYDPNGSPETYDGYYSKQHSYTTEPSSVNGQETLIWHSSNNSLHPDTTWTLLNGQGRVRKAPNEAFDSPSPIANGILNFDDSNGFYGSPEKYDWRFVEKREMLVPYNCNSTPRSTVQEFIQPAFPNPDILRWEKHRMWVVEATLHQGEDNVSARRRLYLDEDTWAILLADMYDADDVLWKTTQVYNQCVPSVPYVLSFGFTTWNLLSGDYDYTGNISYPPDVYKAYVGPQSADYFDPAQMAASASF